MQEIVVIGQLEDINHEIVQLGIKAPKCFYCYGYGHLGFFHKNVLPNDVNIKLNLHVIPKVTTGYQAIALKATYLCSAYGFKLHCGRWFVVRIHYWLQKYF